MRLFKGAISGQKNPAYCGAETALGACNRYEVARKNGREKGDHSHAAHQPMLLHRRLTGAMTGAERLYLGPARRLWASGKPNQARRLARLQAQQQPQPEPQAEPVRPPPGLELPRINTIRLFLYIFHMEG